MISPEFFATKNWQLVGLSENSVPNGFADHYPYFLWLFFSGYTPFSDIRHWYSTHVIFS